MKIHLLYSIICALLAATYASAEVNASTNASLPQVTWQPCGEELKAQPLSTDVQVTVNQCPNPNSPCQLKKGESAILTIKFKTSEAVSNLERIVIARVPAALDRKVEMPYGPPISPCTNSSMLATDGTGCVEGGVDANKSYSYASNFDVLKSFPSVKEVETRIILRQFNEKHRKLRHYRKHPGPTVFCVLIPNIEVVE